MQLSRSLWFLYPGKLVWNIFPGEGEYSRIYVPVIASNDTYNIGQPEYLFDAQACYTQNTYIMVGAMRESMGH